VTPGAPDAAAIPVAPAPPPARRGPAYRIETARLVVRCWQPSDAPLLHDAIVESVEHLRPWLPWIAAEPQTVGQRVDLLRHFRGLFDLDQDYVYGIFDRAETQVFGGTGLHPRVGPHAREIGYWIRAGAIQQGLANEAVAALTRVAFEVDRVARVEIHCGPDNVRSVAIPRRLGFRHEATLRRRALGADGALRDTMIWTVLPEEYAASPLAAVPVQAHDCLGRELL
jgi:RimJ/RimL family protein N-acetyltransferase